MVGPPLGGFITTYFDWRWIFLVNLPIGALGMWFAWRFIPATRERAPPLDWLGFALAGGGLGAAMFGFSTLGQHLIPFEVAVAALVLGLAGLVGYVFHERRHEHALLDLTLFRFATFRAGVVGGSLFRIGIGASPFLLPLMLQIGFGLSPVQSGLITFVSAIGAIFMKTLAARTLNLLGFRRVLLWNALAASGFLVAFGLFRPSTPELVILATLLVSGCCRALQFTSLNAITFADVDNTRMAQASSLSGMLQQLSLSLGVAIGGYALEIVGLVADRPATELGNFTIAFLVVGVISAASAFYAWRLPRNAGAEMAGRARTAREGADPSTAEQPAG
jgi:MFS family permease